MYIQPYLISIGKGTSSKATAAKKVASALKKGNGRKATRVHTKVHFYKPKTLKLARSPKVDTVETKKRVAKAVTSKAYDIVKYPLTTETAMKNIEVSLVYLLFWRYMSSNVCISVLLLNFAIQTHRFLMTLM